MIRSKGEAGTGDVSDAVTHMRSIRKEIRRVGALSVDELYVAAKELQAPYDDWVGVEASKIGSGQAPCPKGLDVVRAYGGHSCALPSRLALLLALRPARRARRCTCWPWVTMPMSGCSTSGSSHRRDRWGARPLEWSHSYGRREVVLVDAPCFGRPVKVLWRKRTWRCVEPSCLTKVFTEQDEHIARPGHC